MTTLAEVLLVSGLIAGLGAAGATTLSDLDTKVASIVFPSSVEAGADCATATMLAHGYALETGLAVLSDRTDVSLESDMLNCYGVADPLAGYPTEIRDIYFPTMDAPTYP